MIDQQTIARIMDAAQITDVVSEFVTLKKRGANYWGVCPFHNEKTPSFSVSPAKGIFKCFGCGEGGNAVHFIMKHENMNYVDALRFLAKKYHIEIEEHEETDEEKQQQKERESLFTANEFAAKHFENTLRNHIDGQSLALSYLRERGFTDEVIRKFRIGYALDSWNALTDAAKTQGYNLDFFEKVGLCKRNEEKNSIYDFFRGRVMFPWLTLSGKVVAFTGRVLARETKGVNQKYVNTGETPIFVKNNEIFGVFQAKNAIAKADCVYMVEGQTDVISMHQCGIENVVACSGGNGLSETQAHTLHRFTSNIVLMYDKDVAGEKDTDAAIVVALNEGMNVSVVRLPDGEDPDSFARAHNANEFIDYIAEHKTDFATYICHKILNATRNNPTKKAQMIGEELIPAIALVRDTMTRHEFYKTSATLLDIHENNLSMEVDKYRARKYKEKIAKQNNVEDEKKPEQNQQENYNHLVATDKFSELERTILNFALRHGNEPIFSDENGAILTVNHFIVNQLMETDLIQFKHPLHQTILYEISAHLHDENFDAAHFFTQNANPDISLLAADLLTDKYTLSKIFTEKKAENAPDKNQKSSERTEKIRQKQRQEQLERLAEDLGKVIIEYKNLIIIDKLEEAMKQLKTASESGNTAAMPQILEQIAQLNQLKVQLSDALGKRVIVKLG